jgi:predicted P-loop ATPase
MNMSLAIGFGVGQSRAASIDTTQAEAFLKALGKHPANACLRAFPNKGSANYAAIGPRKGGWDLEQAAAWNQQGRSGFLVIGNGGHKAADITSCPAIFCEWDNRPMEWQLSAWRELGLPEPSIQVASGGKSIHTYWVFLKPISPEQWRNLQARLIAHCQSDPSLKDPSRVMRLPGFAYIGPDDKPSGWAELIHLSDNRYLPAELEACLPELEPTPAPAPAPAPGPGPGPGSQRLQLVAGGLAGELPPRGFDQIREALAYIPPRSPGSYETHRRALAGLIAAVEQAGGTEDQAIALMEGHCPSASSGWNVAQVARSSTTREAATFWAIASEHGYNLSRDDLRASHRPRPRAQGFKPEPEPNATGASKAKRRRLAADEVMAQLPQAMGHLRLNTRSSDIAANGQVLPRNDISRLYLRLSSETESWPKETTADAVIELASREAFDPVAEYLEALPPNPLPVDQWQRLDQHLLGIDDPIAAAFLPRFLISAVARVYEPGCECRQLPVLIGPQWRGKSTLGRILFGDNNWVDDKIDITSKDSLLACHTAWGVELAELDGVVRRSDAEALKAWISARTDTIRKPYDRSPEKFQRRFVFWGTSNGTPLRDLTGNSRYVCIPIPDRMLPLDWAKANRDAIWARALAEYRAGAAWADCSEAERQAITERNLDHRETDPWSEEIAKFLENRRQAGDLPVQVPDVLKHLGVTPERQTNALAARVRGLAESIGWVSARRRRVGSQEKKQGLWPPGHPGHPDGHPGHTGGHPGGHPDKPSHTNDSQPLGTPGTPKQEKLKTKELGNGHPSNPPATETAAVENFSALERFGVPGVPTDENPSDRNGFGRAPRGAHRGAHRGAQGCPSGCPAEEEPYESPERIADTRAERIPQAVREQRDADRIWERQHRQRTAAEQEAGAPITRSTTTATTTTAPAPTLRELIQVAQGEGLAGLELKTRVQSLAMGHGLEQPFGAAIDAELAVMG